MEAARTLATNRLNCSEVALMAMWCSPLRTSAYTPEFKAREVEVDQIATVVATDVEVEVGRPPAVPVLEQLGQRELQQVLDEGGRSLGVARNHGEVVEATGRRRSALPFRTQVLPPQVLIR
jgi:hypothetical protein